jgi:APA family basic amino acid/polyamine antiporter
LGVLVNLGLMAGLGAITWVAFLIWMAVGLSIYFTYSRYTSLVQTAERTQRQTLR